MRLITPSLTYWMYVHSVKPMKGNCIWMTGALERRFTETVHYVVLRALSQDMLSVLGSPRLSPKHSLFHIGQKDSSSQPHASSFGHKSHTHPFPLVKSFSAIPLLHFPKLLAVPPPPHSPLNHLGYCPPFSPFMLLTLLRNVVFLTCKKGPEGQANREMLNTWFPHVLLIFPCTASLSFSLCFNWKSNEHGCILSSSR